MTRPARYRHISRGKSEAVPKQMVFVDCETRDCGESGNENHEIHRLWFGYASYGIWEAGKLTRRKEIVFTTTREFWDWLREVAKPTSRIWLFAHNVGFDLTILDMCGVIRSGEYKTFKPTTQPGLNEQYDKRKGNQLGVLILEDPPTVISLQRDDGAKLIILDTLNYWRTSLKALGKSVGLEKYDMPDYDVDYETWVKYCKRDVEIIELSITRLIGWWKSNKLGKFGFTSPSLAMAAFRHTNKNANILAHQEDTVRVLERNSYFGGQLESYHIGKIDEKIYQYDVASLYPSVMKNNVYPVHLLEYDITDRVTDGFPSINPSHSTAEVFINSPSDTFPVRVKQGVLYMNGRGWVTLAGPELYYAKQMGYIEKTRSWATYECAELFNSYVDYFWDMKISAEREDDYVQRTFAKLMLNSLYGKFGQMGSSLVPVTDYMPIDEFGLCTVSHALTGKITRYVSFFDVVLREEKGKELQFSVPAISAFVTSYARQTMRKLKTIVGAENYYYMSTDCLIVNANGRIHLQNAKEINPGVLGKLNLEAKGDNGWIGGLHFYRIGSKSIEGSKKASAETIDQFTWREPHFDSLKSVIQQGGKPEINITKMIKRRSLEYRKGCVLENGKIEPFRLDSIDSIKAYSISTMV